MANFVKCAKVDDIPAGEALQVEVEGKTLALVRNDGEVYCISDICSHEHAFLSEGFVEECEIECPLHGSIFDVRTGEVKSLPATENVKTFPTKIEDGEVLVDVSDDG